MRRISSNVLLAAAVSLAAASTITTPAAAQRRMEFGVDVGARFGLGDQSSVNIDFPGTRFRVGFFQPNSRLSIEPALGFSYNKVEGVDGIFTYDLELGALYHFRPIVVTSDTDPTPTRIAPPYVRPFVGLTGFSGGDADDTEFSAGVGLGTKIPWRRDLATRLEVNVGYGFDNEAARIGLLAGFSFFPR